MLVTMGAWYDPGNLLKTGVKVALAPITVPLQLSADAIRYGVDQGRSTIQGIRGALQPPKPAGGLGSSDPAAALVVGAGPNPLGNGGGSSSNLPLIIGGVAAVGLLVTALVLRGRR